MCPFYWGNVTILNYDNSVLCPLNCWLKTAGFAIGDKVRVRVQHGRLVLTTEEG